MFSNIRSHNRTHESPMDWEWQTTNGPADPNSPFPQFKPQEGKKPTFETPQPASSFITASPAKAAPFRNPSFTTPRKPFDPDLYSEASGAETSPADNCEDTPEIEKIRTAMAVLNKPLEKKPLFGKYGASFLGNSPARIEQRRGKYGTAIVNKVRKRKRIERDYQLARAFQDSDSEPDSGELRPRSKAGKTTGEPTTQTWIASILSGIESRPNLPHVLSVYTQLGMNFFLLMFFVFFIYTFWTAVVADVDKAAEAVRDELLKDMRACTADFVKNGCGLRDRPPALDQVCDAWQFCMDKDPNAIGRAKVSAHTFAHIFNSFVEPISYKAMIFMSLTVIGCFVANNLAWGMFRSKQINIPPPQPYFPPQPNFQWGAPPETPPHQTPRHNIGYDAYGSNTYQAIMPSQTPVQRSPSKTTRSPSKEHRGRSPSKMELY